MVSKFSEFIANALELHDQYEQTPQHERIRAKGLLYELHISASGIMLGGVAGVVVNACFWTGVYAGAGAVAGEVMDHIPYIQEHIPRVIQEITGSDYFHGNLDKLCSTLGLLSLYVKPRVVRTETKIKQSD